MCVCMYICYGTSTVLSVLPVAMWPCQLEEERAAYRSELYRQARSKRVEAQMEREQGLQKEKEVRQLCAGGRVGEMCYLLCQSVAPLLQHVDVFNSQWGRPGGGAPKQGSQGRQANLMPPFAVTRRRS